MIWCFQIKEELMGTRNGITRQSTTEIIPSSELPEFNKALVTLEDLEDQLVPLSDEARKIKIESGSDFARAGELMAKLKEADKATDATMLPYKAILKKVTDYIRTRSQRVTNKVEETKGVLVPKMAEWTRKEASAAAAEQERKQREEEARLKREAEEKRQKDEAAAKELRKERVNQIRQDLREKKITVRQSEKLLREAGALEEAAKAQISADEADAKAKAAEKASHLKVEPNIPTVAGVVKRKNWKFKITNPYKVNIRYMVPDEVAIGEVVRRLKNKEQAEAEIGGIEVWEEASF